jgi:succinate dehydrogenase / fumarate reductase, flavoprotein subunit
MTIEIREGRGVGPLKDHIYLHLEHLGAELLHDRLPGISESARIFSGVDVTREPIPVLPTAHYNMGGVRPTTWARRSRPATAIPTPRCRDLLAVGETACASVHGANRLGSNSLTDLVVFGRAAALKCAETIERGANSRNCRAMPARPRSPGLTGSAMPTAARPPRSLRLRMQRTMQDYCAVFRTEETLAEGVERIRQVWAGIEDIKVSDRSLIWNSDLVETLEWENLISQASRHHRMRARPHREPRRPCARGLSRPRRRKLVEAFARLGRLRQAPGHVGSRPVHSYTLSNEIEYIKPKARVY